MAEQSGVYADPDWVTLVIYPEDEDITWQRVICAKELIHICDRQIVKTQTPEMVDELARKLVGPFETSDPEPSDLMASMDKLAHYQSFNLLFPRAARKLAVEKIRDGTHTVEDIAEWAVIPQESLR